MNLTRHERRVAASLVVEIDGQTSLVIAEPDEANDRVWLQIKHWDALGTLHLMGFPMLAADLDELCLALLDFTSRIEPAPKGALVPV